MKFRTLKELDQSEGSVILIEPAGHAAGRHAKSRHQKSDLVLVPQPTSDPNDPLNWPRSQKTIAFLCVCLFTFMSNVSTGGISPAFYGLSLEFNRSMDETTGLLSWCILVLGLGNFFWVPTALYLGKRPVFILALLMLTVTNIWSALSPSFNSLFAARMVMGFAGGSTEALGAAIVNDLYFLHERGAYMGVYIVALAWGNAVGGLVGGFIIAGPGWRWFCWVCSITCGVNLLAVVFLVPETRYDRNVDLTHQALAHTQPVKLNDMTGSEKFPATSNVDKTGVTSASIAKPPPQQKRTYLQALSPWSGIAPNANFFNLLLRPFPLVMLPAVMYAFLSYSITLACALSISTLNSFVLQAPPYLWTPATNGLINVPGIIGISFGAVVGGILTDVFSARAARKHNGVFHPESRLVLLVIPGVLVPAGLLMFGFGAQRTLHWSVMFVGNGLVSVGLSAVANIGMLFVVDSYYPVAAEALLLVNGLKNVFAFGFLYGLVPWATQDGYIEVFGALAGIFVGILCLGVPIFIFGQRIRDLTARKLRIVSW